MAKGAGQVSDPTDVGRGIHPTVDGSHDWRVDHPPYIEAENVSESAKFQTHRNL